MPRNGSGTFSLVSNSWNPAVNGNNATAADWQTLANDLANGLTQSVSSDGQTPFTGNLPMGNNKITGLANATLTTDAINLGQARSLGPTFPGAGVSLTANVTLTTSQAGNWCIFTVPSVTATLPAAAALVIGQTYTFAGGSAGGTVKGNAAETITAPTLAAANTYVLAVGETIEIACNGSGWYVVSSGFGGSTFVGTKTIPGYQKLPGGLIMQWGTGATTAGGVTITWPIAFPNSVLVVTSAALNTAAGMITYQAPTSANAFFQGWNTSGTQVNAGFSFIAIGF